MNPWTFLDEKFAQFRRDLDNTKQAVRELGGSYVRADDLGYWRCSFNLGDGCREYFRERSPGELIAKLKAFVNECNVRGGSR